MSCMVLFEHELDHQTCAKNQGQFTRLPLSSLGVFVSFPQHFQVPFSHAQFMILGEGGEAYTSLR